MTSPNRFCLYCGALIDGMSPASPQLTCTKCGKSFPNPFVPQQAAGKSSGLPLVLLAVLAVPFVVAVIGILAAIAIPNFIKFQSRSKQLECKTALKSLVAAEEHVLTDTGAYSASFEALHFEAPLKNRYAYLLGPAPEGVIAPDPIHKLTFEAGEAVDRAGLEPGVVDGAYTAVCVGQIDRDVALDVWSVSSKERTVVGKRVAAFEPFHHVDDVTEYE